MAPPPPPLGPWPEWGVAARSPPPRLSPRRLTCSLLLLLCGNRHDQEPRGDEQAQRAAGQMSKSGFHDREPLASERATDLPDADEFKYRPKSTSFCTY